MLIKFPLSWKYKIRLLLCYVIRQNNENPEILNVPVCSHSYQGNKQLQIKKHSSLSKYEKKKLLSFFFILTGIYHAFLFYSQ